jgi:hypothetical protein
MDADEGVVKFKQKFTRRDPFVCSDVRDLIVCRQLLYVADLIGQNPASYGGAPYGNVSQRIWSEDGPSFFITGTQTSGLREVTSKHITLVERCFPEKNLVVVSGPIEASSESMSHWAVYEALKSVNFVFHVHSPHIWRAAKELGIPVTDANVKYGTPEMAEEILKVLGDYGQGLQVLAMGGHEDGVMAYGETGYEAGLNLLKGIKSFLSIRN